MTEHLSDHDWQRAGILLASRQKTNPRVKYIPYLVTHGAAQGRWIAIAPEFEKELGPPSPRRDECDKIIAALEREGNR